MMVHQRLLVAFTCGSLFAILPFVSSAQEINGVTVFGDSLSDNGNTYRFTGNRLPPSPPYFEGRFSNGPVWAEYFAADAQFSTTPANFAFGGAQSGTANTENRRFPPGALPTPLPGFQNEVDFALQASPNLDPNRLYVVWIGANDYLNGGITNPAIPVGNISTGITKLNQAGATNVMVFNLPDVGKSPGVSSQPPQQRAGLSQLIIAHNSALNAALQTEAQNNKLNIIPVDIYALFNEIIADPATYGFQNVTQACLNSTTGAVCANPNQYVFWDDIHPTTATHQIISQYALSILNAPQAIAPQANIALSLARRQTRDIDGRLLTLRLPPGNVVPPQLNSGSAVKQLDNTPAIRSVANPNTRVGVFVNGDVNFGDQKTSTSQSGYNFTTRGITVGADYRLTKNVALGGALSYANNNTNLNNNLGKIDADGYAASIYGSYDEKKFYLDGVVSYGWNQFDVKRTTNFFNRTATASTNGNQLSARLNTGYNLSKNNLSVGPTAGIRYDHINIDGYEEKGADSLNMRVHDQNTESVVLNLGGQISYSFNSKSSKIIPYFQANYEHELANNNREVVTEILTQPGIPIRTKLGNADNDYVRLSTGIQAHFVDNTSFGIGYETLLGRDGMTDNYINTQLRFQF